MKLVVDVFGCTPGISTRSSTNGFVNCIQFSLAAKLREFVIGVPDLKKELKAALFDSAFPNVTGKDSKPLRRVHFDTPGFSGKCSTCSRYLSVGAERDEGLVFSATYDSRRLPYCLKCAKAALTVAWRDFMMDDGRQEDLL